MDRIARNKLNWKDHWHMQAPTSSAASPVPVLPSQAQLPPTAPNTRESGAHTFSAVESQPSVEQFQQLQAQLDRARRLAMVGELTSTTTHEFNNLLTTILNYAKLGQRHKDDASRDKAFTRILDAANRAAKITTSVLSLARQRSGHMEPTDLKQVVQDTLILIEREFRKYGIHLEVAIDDDVPRIHGCSGDLQRVLLNLLVNARQATPEGGSVRLSLQVENKPASEVVLSIRDSGSGIPPEVLPKIFDPFFSTKTGPDSSGKGGTGVGLASCKEIIDAHAGRIRVESSLGRGTAFYIRLPALVFGHK